MANLSQSEAGYEPELTGCLSSIPTTTSCRRVANSTNSAARHSKRTMLSSICGRFSPPLGRPASRSSSPRTIGGAKVIRTAIGRRCRPSRHPPHRDTFSLTERGVEVFTPISSRVPAMWSRRNIGSQVGSPTPTSTSSSRSRDGRLAEVQYAGVRQRHSLGRRNRRETITLTRGRLTNRRNPPPSSTYSTATTEPAPT